MSSDGPGGGFGGHPSAVASAAGCEAPKGGSAFFSVLLCDAADRAFEQTLVITNDSDLALPVRLVKEKFRLKIGVYSPRPKVTESLRRAATFCRPLRHGPIEASQFSSVLADEHGFFSKPPHW